MVVVQTNNALEKKSIMWEYLAQTQDLLRKNDYSAAAREVLDKMDVAAIKNVIFVAHGSSYNVSLVAAHWLREFAHVDSSCMIPFSFSYHIDISKTMEPRETLIVGISQTGTSRGTLEAVEHAKSLDYSALTITDVRETPVALAGDYYLNIGCGEENSNAKTKGVSCSLVLLQRFVLEMGLKKGSLSQEKYDAINREIDDSIEEIDKIIEVAENWIATNDFGKEISDICFLAHGKNDGIALEGMLKMTETVCVPGVWTGTEEFSHGIHRYIKGNSHLVITNTGEVGRDYALKTFEYFKDVIPNCLLINAAEPRIEGDRVINIAERKYTETSLGLMIVIHVLSIAVPEKNGLDPNVDANNQFTKFISTRVEDCNKQAAIK